MPRHLVLRPLLAASFSLVLLAMGLWATPSRAAAPVAPAPTPGARKLYASPLVRFEHIGAGQAVRPAPLLLPAAEGEPDAQGARPPLFLTPDGGLTGFAQQVAPPAGGGLVTIIE